MSNLEKKFDPGWNDPPVLNYSASNPPPKSRIANKRVAFPLKSTTDSNTIGTYGTSGSSVQPDISSGNEFKEVLYQQAKNDLNEILVNIDNADIKSQIESMFTQWEEKKFPENLQVALSELTTFLREKNTTDANRLHLEISMKYGIYCNKWISAIRNLINL